MSEASSIIGTCINCGVAPGSLLATLALIVIGFGVAVRFELQKAHVRTSKNR